jgi:Phosphorylated CTD interacting factor 1 WW domain
MTTKIQLEYINFIIRYYISLFIDKKYLYIWERVIEFMIWNRINFGVHNNDIFCEILQNEQYYIKKDIVKNSDLIKIPNIDVNKLADDVVDFINNKYDKTKNILDDTSNSIKKTKKYINYRNLQIHKDERINLLIERTSSNIVLRMLLRYTSLGISSEQCSIPSNVYFYLYDTLNIKGEGYASPLNSKLISKKDIKFCSVFYDTDKYFGSLGPFSKKALVDNQNINWLCNPPYISYVVKKTVTDIVDAFDEITNENFLVILIAPDQNVYKYIRTIPLVAKYIIPEEGAHYMNCNGNVVQMKGTINCMYFFTKNKSLISDDVISKVIKIWNTYEEDKHNQSYFTSPTVL